MRMFDSLVILSKNTFELFSILMSCRHINAFSNRSHPPHVHACGSQRNHPNRIRIRLATLVHVKKDSLKDQHPNASACGIVPIDEPVAVETMKQSHVLLKSHLPKFCILHLPLVHAIGGNVVMNKLEVILPIILHAIPNYPPKIRKPSSLNFLQETT